MAFPATKLSLIVELALGADLSLTDLTTWTWTDITRYVRFADGITITRGRGDEFSTASPSKASLTLLNDGRFVVRNPTGAYYGLIARNTPLRVLVRPDVNTATDAFGRTVSNGWGTADTGGAWTVVGTAGDYSTTSGVGRITHPSAAVRHYAVLPVSQQTFDVRVRVRTGALATGAALSAGVVFRYVDSSNSTRFDILFNTDQTMQVRAALRVAGVDSFGAVHATGLTHAANTFYRLRVRTITTDGTHAEIKVWADAAAEPDAWTARTTVAAGLAAGNTGLTSSRETSNTTANATVDFEDFSLTDGWYPRHTGFVDEWPTRWNDAGLKQMLAPITASGMLRRLQQGTALGSAIKRGVLTAGVTPRAYWPCEDGSSATQIASGIPGGLPMRVQQPESLGSGRAAGSDPVITASGNGRIQGNVQPYTGTDWTVMCLINVPSAPPAGQALLQWYTSGSYITWQLVLTPQAGVDLLTLQAYDAGIVERLGDTGVNFTGEPYGKQLWVEVSATQVGADISWSYFVWDVSGKTGTKTGATAGTVTGVSFGAGSGADQLSGTILGHISVWDNATVSLGALACVGWSGEASYTRLARLRQQESVPLAVTSTPTTSDYAIMGAPTSGTLLSQIQEIEAAEQGIVYDDVDGRVVLLMREDRVNQAVGLTLDIAQKQVSWPLEPADDDQKLHNDVASSSPTGSSYRYLDTTSPSAVQRVGYYSTTRSVNLAYDPDLRQDAEFATALGTVDEIRYPLVPLNLTRQPGLIPAWLGMNIGNRFQITHPPSLLTPDLIDLILEGYTERLDSETWSATLNTSSARPWNAWILENGSGNQSRLDSEASTLAGAVSAGATTLPVATTPGFPLWAFTSAFDIGVGGEQITVTAISAALFADTFTRSVSSSWGTATTGQSWTTSGGSAADYGVNGTRGTMALTSTGVERTAVLAGIGPDIDVTVFVLPTVVATGAQFEHKIRIRHNGTTWYETNVQYQTGGTITVYLVSGVATVLSALAAVATYGSGTTFGVRMQAVGSTIRQKVWDAAGAEPAAWTATVTDTTYAGAATDNLMLEADRVTSNTNAGLVVQWDNLTVSNSQAFTVTRAVNGVSKAQTAGTKVSLWRPSVLAL